MSAARTAEKVDQSAAVLPIPKKLSQHWRDFDTMDAIFAVCVLFVSIPVAVRYRMLGWALVIVTGLVLLARRGYSRIYRTHLENIASLWIAFVDKDYLYLNPETKADHEHLPRARHGYAMPVAVHALHDIGLLHARSGRLDGIVITGQGSDYASLSPRQQFQRLGNLAEATTRIGDRNLSTGFSWLYRTDPFDPTDLDRIFENSLQPDVFLPEGVLYHEDEWDEVLSDQEKVDVGLNLLARELRDMAIEDCRTVYMAAIVAMRQSRTIRNSLRKGQAIAATDLPKERVARIARSASNALRSCGVQDVQVLDPDALHRYVHGAWNVSGDGEYAQLQREGATRPVEEIGEDGKTRISYPTLHWPKSYIRTSNTRSFMDGNEHAVLRVTGNPEIVLGDFFDSFFSLETPWSAVTVAGEITSAKSEVWLLNRGMGVWSAFQDVMHKRVKTTAEELRDADRKERERAITLDQYWLQLYNTLIAVSGPEGSGVVDDGIMEVEDLASHIGVEVELIKGRVRQVPWLMTARTGLNLV